MVVYNWTTWSNNPGSFEDPYISDAQSSSPGNSVVIVDGNNAILPLTNYWGGAYKISFNMYIPAGKNGYFSLLQLFNGAGSEWGMQVFFDAGGMGSIDGGGQNAAGFTYLYDTWMLIETSIDMNNDWAEFFIDGNFIHSWIWSSGAFGTGTLNQLGGINLKGWYDNGPCEYYVDNVVFEALYPPGVYGDDFETYDDGDFLSVENPAWWMTWSNQPGSAEDAPVTDAMAYSGTKSVLLQESTNVLLKLGDKIAGTHKLEFRCYIPSGFGGYFNVQHYESPGIEWAYEVYFAADGTGELYAESVSAYAFTYPKDQWFLIENYFDLDCDVAALTIDGNLVHEWEFSVVAGGGPGTKQLGSINFYAGAPAGETAMYFVDDIEFDVFCPWFPIISVNPVSITENLQAGSTLTETISIQNSGGSDLIYDIFITFQGGPATDNDPGSSSQKEVVLNLPSVSHSPAKCGNLSPSDDIILHYDGENTTAFGLANGGEMKSVAMFPASMINEYIGMELTSMDCYIHHPPNSTRLLVYEYGKPDIPGPGGLIREEQWLTSPGEWNTVNLDSPVLIEGGDLWIGYAVDHLAGLMPSGTDGGPAVPNGDWISAGTGWYHLSDNPDYNCNWNIRAHLTGTPVVQWLSVSPVSGTVAPNASETVDVNFDASGLSPGAYKATIVVNNNDLYNSQVEVDVFLDILTGLSETEYAAVLIYPNPVSDHLNIRTNSKIIRVHVFNLMQQIVYSRFVDEMTHSIGLSSFPAGIYIVRIDTPEGAVSRRIVVK